MLLGLTGTAQAGKDTAYQRLVELFPGLLVERLAFADKLYASAAASLGVDEAVLRATKTDPGARVQLVLPHPSRSDDYPVTVLGDVSVRGYLQLFGTEGHRDIFGTDFWVSQVTPTHEGRLVCITDVRFPNEADHVHAIGGHVVRIFGPGEVGPQAEAERGHASEAGLPLDAINFQVDNTKRDDGFKALDFQLARIVNYLVSEGVA